MKKTVVGLLVSSGILMLLLIGGAWYQFCYDKIGYVRTGIVLESYKGSTRASEEITSQVKLVQANIDSLAARVEGIRHDSSITKEDERKYAIARAEQELRHYQENALSKVEESRQQLLNKTFGEINDYISAYGKEQGYRIILGTTSGGNILYGSERDDLTDTIIKGLNEGNATK